MSRDAFRSLREREFADLGSGVFFDAASFGILPRRTVEAVAKLSAARTRAGGFIEEVLGEALERARTAAARLVGAGADEIVLAPNTSYGVNLASALVAAGEPGTVVVSEGEFPANVLPWLPLEEEGFRVERVPTDDLGRPDEERLRERLDRNDVRAFALSAVQFATGHRADVEGFGALCRERDVLFCVDAIQLLGAAPLDVEAARVDVLASGGQKWLCSPWGSGFAYVRRELQKRFEPPMVSWLSVDGATDFGRPLEYHLDFVPDGRKFELGTLGIQDYAGLARSVEMFLEVGVERVREHLLEVQRPLVEWIDAAPHAMAVSPLDPGRRAGIVSFRVPSPEGTAAVLRDAGFHISVREGAVRISPHLYNTVEEMEALVETLDGERAMQEGW